jgi:hypothetical protein
LLIVLLGSPAASHPAALLSLMGVVSLGVVLGIVGIGLPSPRVPPPDIFASPLTAVHN